MSEAIVTPMGAFDFHRLREIQLENSWHEFALNYFLWFHEKKEVYYMRNTAMYRMWNDVYWGDTLDEDSIAIAQNIASSLKEARNQKKDIELPKDEYEELASIACENTRLEGPYMNLPDKIGYRRGKTKYYLPNNWSIVVPGEFREVFSSINEYPVKFYSKDRLINFTFAFSYKSGENVNKEVTVLKQSGGYKFVSMDSFSYTNNGKTWHQMNCIVLYKGKVLELELEGRGDEWDNWAIGAFESIRYIENS